MAESTRSNKTEDELVASLQAMPELQRSHFPFKLHRILNDAGAKGFQDIISWTPDGRAFQIFDKKRFEKEVMPLYFSSGRFQTVSSS